MDDGDEKGEGKAEMSCVAVLWCIIRIGGGKESGLERRLNLLFD